KNDDCKQARAPYCDGFNGCVECVLDGHCANGQRCEDNACVQTQACSVSADCTNADKPVCNWVLGECARCVFAVDCGENAICDQGSCVSVTPCVNSLDCSNDSVCDRNLGYCVECISDGDCGETHACVSNKCIARCQSDKGCTAAGELCNVAAGYCVECVEEEDCPDLYHCDSGSCKVDVCLQEHSTCVTALNAREVCRPNGSQTDAIDCSFGTTCVQDGATALCMPWTCPPGSARCSDDATKLEICDADGLGGTITADCVAAGGVCENNSCNAVVCPPSSVFCDGQTGSHCNVLGTSLPSLQVCIS